MFSRRKGVFWLLLAIAAEIPPVVSLDKFLGHRLFVHLEFHVSDIHFVRFKRYFSLA